MNEKQKADSDEYIRLTKLIEAEAKKKKNCDKNLNYLFYKVEQLDESGELNFEYISNSIENERQRTIKAVA